MRRLVAALLLLLGPVPAAHALRLRACPHERGFGCATLRVPLDPSGRVPGSLGLRVAAQDSAAARRKPPLIALTGGPGQEGVAFAPGEERSLAPLLRSSRLVLLDQRGTGASGALRCPALQREPDSAPVLAGDVAACAQAVGPRRAFFSTADTVADLDRLRVALGARKLALMGISYGTYVAVQYARVHPEQTARLVLDSVVGPGGVDPLTLDTLGALPRVLRETCRAARCRGATSDFLGDVGAVLGAAPLHGRFVDADGRATSASLDLDGVFGLLLAGDLNPFEQAALPAAFAAARAGDLAPLLRLRRAADGPPTTTRELSAGLNVATDCEDGALPFGPATPLGVPRNTALAQAVAAVPATAYAPLDAADETELSLAGECLAWPEAGSSPPSQAPLPDVPALLLSGRLDLRTPNENALALARQLPHATLVRVPGNGHDELDSDVSGCAARALARFARGSAVGDPCRGHSDQVRPFARPVASFSAYPQRGRVDKAIAAVDDTIADAQESALQDLYGDVAVHGGGLRGGRWSQRGSVLSLVRDAVVPGLRVSGRVEVSEHGERGRVQVAGLAHGFLRFTGRGGSGRLDGQSFRLRPGSAASVGALRRAPLPVRRLARLPLG